MQGKIINIPNLISATRILILAPLAGYFFLMHENLLGFSMSALVIISDVLDGYLARKLKQATNLGIYLDSTGDNLFLAVLVLSFLYLGYLDLEVIALFAAHRLTRLILILYIAFYGKGVYSPSHIKVTGFIPMIYILFIPFIFEYLGKDLAKFITIGVAATTYFALVLSVFVAIYQFKKGQIEIYKLEKVPVRKIVREKKTELIAKHKVKKAARKQKRQQVINKILRKKIK